MTIKIKNIIIRYGQSWGILFMVSGCASFIYGTGIAMPWYHYHEDKFLYYGFFVALAGYALWVTACDYIHYKKMDQLTDALLESDRTGEELNENIRTAYHKHLSVIDALETKKPNLKIVRGNKK